MSTSKFSELNSIDVITAKREFFSSHSSDDETWLIKLYINLLPEFDIDEKQSHNHHLDQLSNSKSSPMDLLEILDENGKSFLYFSF
jgi:hypothetical protein